MSATVYDQSSRYLAIQTELGQDRVILTELEGEDTLSKPFVYRIRFATDEAPSSVRTLLGSEVTIQFGMPNSVDESQDRRVLHGVIRRLSRVGRVPQSTTGMAWEAEVVPHLWFLSLASDFRIFQDMTIPDIVSAVLNDNGMTGKFALRPTAMSAGYGTLEYCVQYNESALDFVSRLMEQAGLFYWHEHAVGGHTLVISEDNSYARLPSPSYGTLAIGGTGYLTRFDEHFAFRTGKWTVRDYNMLDPDTEYDRTAEWGDLAGAATTVATAMKQRERYKYPGLYMARVHASSVDFGGSQSLVGSTDAATMSDLLIAAEEANWHRWSGDSQAAGLDPGTKVRIDTDLGTANDEADFLVTSVKHKAVDYSHWTAEMWGGRAPIPRSCTTAFECLPFSIPFRPERTTPKPAVQGPQTAVVVGPAGEEINTDKYGRVKLQFPWDRRTPTTPDTRTCWVRVTQGWSSNGWGQIHLPRVGDEVVVDFIDGDPDRPIVTGRVYHHTRMPTYELPANKAKSGIRTRSYPGGTSDNYNELMFDDAIGSENVLLHAEKDYTVEVENNETRTIGIGSKTGNRTTSIKNDEAVTIGGNKTVTLTGNFTETISGTETRTVTGNITETASGTVTITVAGALSIHSDTSITLDAPSVTSNSTSDSDFSTGYDWTMGQMCGSYFHMVNYNGIFATNTFAAAVNTTGIALNLGGVAINMVPVSVNIGAVQFTNKLLDSHQKTFEMKNVLMALGSGALHMAQGMRIYT